MWTKEHRARHEPRLKDMVSQFAEQKVARWLERADPPRSAAAAPTRAVCRGCGWALRCGGRWGGVGLPRRPGAFVAGARRGRAWGWPFSVVASPPIVGANGPTSMACATMWSAAIPDRKALWCCHGAGWSNAALGGLRIGAVCCATAPDGW